MAISPSIGAISRLLSRVRFDPRYQFAKTKAKQTVERLPLGKLAWALSRRLKRQAEGVVLPGAVWEQLGFNYLGPVDGHDIRKLEEALTRARNFGSGPVIVHVLTRKGKGYAQAEEDATRFHGMAPSNGHGNGHASYSKVFSKTVERLMEQDKRVVAITAAMLDGTGLAAVAARFPDRVFDVGICEQHAVTLAAGLATQGCVPIVAIYSTFLQRSYDQIVHDVCLQELPVVFAIDRAGIVGDDGKTHQGTFDISYLRSVPNMVVSAPRDEDELQHLLHTAVKASRPMAVRYPRGEGLGVHLRPDFEMLDIGKSELLRDGNDLAIIAIGSAVRPALSAAEELGRLGIDCSVVNARFAKPVDGDLILDLASRTRRVVTVEENVLAGGFGSAVLEVLQEAHLSGVRVECIGLPDRFIEHGTPELFHTMFNLDSPGIVMRVRAAFPELCIGNGQRGEARW
jgi:1-deoxy-D-xylulose-5-phosphate synthase